MLLNAFIHSITLFVVHQQRYRRQLFDLLANYHPDLGPGFHPSFGDLVTAFSWVFPCSACSARPLLFYSGGKFRIPEFGKEF